MIDKYRRPDYKTSARSYHAQMALLGRDGGTRQSPVVRRAVVMLYAAAAVYAVVFLFLGRRMGTFDFILSPIVQGHAKVVEKISDVGGGANGRGLILAINDARDHAIRTEVRVDDASWGAVLPGTLLRCAFRVNQTRDKVHVVELVFYGGDTHVQQDEP